MTDEEFYSELRQIEAEDRQKEWAAKQAAGIIDPEDAWMYEEDEPTPMVIAAEAVRVGAPVSSKISELFKKVAADSEVKVKRVRKDPLQQRDVKEIEPLFPHQIEAVERYKDKKEIALFWEMGVAKSATVLNIAFEKFLKREINALLIIAPNDVHSQWANQQIPRWYPGAYELQCYGGRGGCNKTYPFQPDETKIQIVCVNIDTFSTKTAWEDIVEWAVYNDTMIVLDEATSIKNKDAVRTERIIYEFNDVLRKGKRVLSSKPLTVCRAVLTGTPITNGASDLWCIMEFLRPNYFNRDWYSFRSRYGMFTKFEVEDSQGKKHKVDIPLNQERWEAIKTLGTYEEAYNIFGCTEDTFKTIMGQDHFEGPYKHADELRALIEPVASFKLLRECREMPPTNYSTRRLTMSAEQQKVYKDMRNEYIAQYEGVTATALNKMTAMLRLQQISSGFVSEKVPEQLQTNDTISLLYGLDDVDIMPGDNIKWIGKSNPKLDALYRDVAEVAKPCIVLTRFSCEAARIYEELSKSYTCCLMTGWKREGSIEDFQEGKYDVMVANIRVIAKGFNLQNSNQILFYSNTYSLENRLQAEGRIFRIGQERVCNYTDYVYADSIDEKIVLSLLMKQKLLDAIRGVELKELI